MAHIVVNLDVMLARRKMRSRELAERVGITEQNISLLKSGKVRGVAVTSKDRNASLPDVPSMRESGIQDYDVGGWYGLFGPNKLAPEFIAKINDATRKALASEELKAKLIEQGYDLWTGTPQALTERTARELALWATVAKTIPPQ